MADNQELLEAPVFTGGERTREEILGAAHDMLTESGFRRFTVAALMERASVSRPAFYQYFASRYDVVAEIVRRISAGIDEVTTPWLEDAEAGPDQLLAGLEGLADKISEDGMLYRGVIDASAADHQVEQAWRYGLIASYCERTEAKIRAAQEAGSIPESLDAELTALGMVLMTERVYYDRLAIETPDDPKRVAKAVCDIWSSTLYPGH
jgi:TetR/AcrR family transcriptional regulator, ethionamide resistance regulator